MLTRCETVVGITFMPTGKSEPSGYSFSALPNFALGTVSLDGGTRAVLLSNGKLLVLDSVVDQLGSTAPISTRDVLDAWDRLLPVLKSLVASGEGEWVPLSDATVLAPVDPRQIVQAGANYRTHVIDLAVKHADIANGRTEEQVRAETAEMMDKRAAEGDPYFFVGLPSAVTGPYDTVTLPAGTHKNDWELELVAVVGGALISCRGTTPWTRSRGTPLQMISPLASWCSVAICRRSVPTGCERRTPRGSCPWGRGSYRGTTQALSPRCG